MAKKTKKNPREAHSEQQAAKEQPRPRLPLLSGGKDSTLAERFKEGLHGRKSG